MKYFLLETNALNSKNNKHAGSKARIDADFIFQNLGYTPIVLDSIYSTEGRNVFISFYEHIKKFMFLKKKLSILKDGDKLIIQFPMINHSVLFSFIIKILIRKNIHVTILIHDIELLRTGISDNVKLKRKLRLILEETSVLKHANKIIVHNAKMKEFLCIKYNFDPNVLVELDIFDYLVPTNLNEIESAKDLPIVIAGNLSPEKAGYVSDLPNDVYFNLYGIGYQNNNNQNNIVYKGSFLPDDLIRNLSGSFGLVWDGNTAETCSGVYGNYLRYNNSHKASLYLVAGYPIIVWKESALADFVDRYHCGISINSLYELKNKIESLSNEDYNELKDNAKLLSSKLKNGYFLEKALNS